MECPQAYCVKLLRHGEGHTVPQDRGTRLPYCRKPSRASNPKTSALHIFAGQGGRSMGPGSAHDHAIMLPQASTEALFIVAFMSDRFQAFIRRYAPIGSREM